MNTLAGESLSHLITHPHCWSGLSDSTVFKLFASLQICVSLVCSLVCYWMCHAALHPVGLCPDFSAVFPYCVPCRFHGCVPTFTAVVLMSLCIVPGCVLCYVSLVCSLCCIGPHVHCSGRVHTYSLSRAAIDPD